MGSNALKGIKKWGDRLDRWFSPSMGEPPRSLEEVDRLDWELVLLVILVMFALLGAFILNHMPGVLPSAEMVLKPAILETYTDGLTILVLMFCLYVIQKRKQLRKIRYQLVEAVIEEEVLKQRLSLIEILFEFSREFTAGEGASEAYGNILESLRHVMRADHASLHLLSTNNQELVLTAFQGSSTFAPPNRIPVGMGFYGSVARTTEPLLLNGSIDRSEFKGLTESEFTLESAVFVPLQVDDLIWGVLGVGNLVETNYFNQSDLKLVNIFGNSMALWIRKNDLINRLEESLIKNEKTRLQLIQTEKIAGLGELMAGISHELNNPLGVIVGNSELMLEGELDDTIRDKMNNINQEALRAKHLVENLLKVARGEEIHGKETNLNEVVVQSLTLLQYQLALDDITIKTNLSDNIPPSVLDSFQIQQLIFNMVNNARQAMAMTERSQRSISVKTVLLPEGSPGGFESSPALFLEIRDTGPGIPEEDKTRIFDPFFTTKEVGSGTGLGLSICYRIVQQIEGRIEAENHPDGGAVFNIWLPVNSEAPPETVEVEEAEGGKEKSSDVRTLMILVVEDEEKMQKIIVEILELVGHQVMTAGNGEEALALLQNSDPPDAILLDLNMPVMDGRELFQRLVKQKSFLANRVLFLTGDTLNPNTRNFLNSVGRPFLNKPFTLDELRDAVEKLILEE